MLDERKVKLMTQLALYDQTQGKEDFKISEYYRKDYAGVHILYRLPLRELAHDGCIRMLE